MPTSTQQDAPRDYKDEARKQWTDDPCGSTTVQGERGTPEYFAAVDQDRYGSYAPWMLGTMPFDQFAGRSVLEIGYGQGTDLMQFAKHGARVTGVDLSPTHQRLAQQRFALANLPTDLRLADAEELPFAAESFDGVYSFGVIHHTPDTQRAIDEVYRVLKPGGRAILGVYHRRSLFALAQWLHHLRGWFPGETLDESYWRIEGQTGGATARPLVKRYSRRELAAMLGAFGSVRFAVRHFGCEGNEFRRIVPPFLRSVVAQRWGWYLIAFCQK